MVTPVKATTYLLRGRPYALIRPMSGVPNELFAELWCDACVEISGPAFQLSILYLTTITKQAAVL